MSIELGSVVLVASEGIHYGVVIGSDNKLFCGEERTQYTVQIYDAGLPGPKTLTEVEEVDILESHHSWDREPFIEKKGRKVWAQELSEKLLAKPEPKPAPIAAVPRESLKPGDKGNLGGEDVPF